MKNNKTDLLTSVNRKKALRTALLLTPSTIILVVFLLMPIAIVVIYSFALRDNFGRVAPGFTLDNYRALFKPLYIPIFYDSLKIAFHTTIISLIAAYPMAYFIVFRGKRHASVLLLMLIIPFWTNFLVRMSAWVVLLNRNGVINYWLQQLHLIDEPIKFLGTYGAVLVGLLYSFLPSAIFPIYASLDAIDPTWLEASQDLGANPAKTFFRIILPLSLPGVVASTLFVFVPAIGVFIIPVILGGGKTMLIGNLIYMLYLEFRNIPFGAAVSIILLLIILVGILLFMRALRYTEVNE